jgi:two-component sensor histidine kinase
LAEHCASADHCHDRNSRRVDQMALIIETPGLHSVPGDPEQCCGTKGHAAFLAYLDVFRALMLISARAYPAQGETGRAGLRGSLNKAKKLTLCPSHSAHSTGRSSGNPLAQENIMSELVSRRPFPQDTLLLDELNHRINNEFASLIGVVSLTAARSSSDEVKRALSAVAQLVHHYAEVHHALQLPDRTGLIDAAAYLGKLCRSISRSKLDYRKIDLILASHPLALESDRCWQLGMIVSELITNAARHAFAGRPGKIYVELLPAAGFVKCRVCDDGSAPACVQAGRGLRIVQELTKALDGLFEREFGPGGTSSILVFPYDEPKKIAQVMKKPEENAKEQRGWRARSATIA